MEERMCFIWRESVYKNKFKCNICGTQIADEKGEPRPNVLVNPRFEIIQCPLCRNVVAHIKMMEVPEGMSGLQGYLGDYERRNKNE